MSTHINESGMPRMVDVGDKPVTRRRAVAEGFVELPIGSEDVKWNEPQKEWWSPKGPVFQTAILAGIQGAKQTSTLIPLCHPLFLSRCDVAIEPIEFSPLVLKVTCTVETQAQTGVEMEALCGVSAACLTIYDMGKSVTKNILIRSIQLVAKTGGTK